MTECNVKLYVDKLYPGVTAAIEKRAKEAKIKQPTTKFTLGTNDKGLIYVKGLEYARILKALYNASIPIANGYLALIEDPLSREEMSLETARSYEKNGASKNYWCKADWDYVGGRPIKVHITNEDFLDPSQFDKRIGMGMCKQLLEVEFCS